MARARRAAMPLATAACLVLAVGLVYMVKRPAPAVTESIRQAPTAEGATAEAPTGVPENRAALAGSVEAELRQAASHYENAIRGLETLAEGSAGRGSADRRHPAEEPAADRSGHRREPRRARARAGEQPAQQSLFEAFRTKIAFLQDTIALVNEMRKGNEAEAARIAEGLKKS